MKESRFEKEWQSLIKSLEHGSLCYSDSSVSIRTVVDSHFCRVQRQEKYGVYVVRRQATMEVLYIGRSGTIKQDGDFKGQDIPRRLKNRKGNMSAEDWFGNLFTQKGPLLIEYVFSELQPKSPSLLESVLLQAYLNEFGRLPYLNKAF